MEVKGKILAKKGDNKAFKLDDDNWYNLNDNVIPYLEKLSKGDEVLVTFEKKGVSRYVSKLMSANVVESKTEPTSTTGFACEVCNAPLKDGRFKKCFMCNKSGATKKEGTTEEKKNYVKTEFKSNYGSPEDIAGKEVGCSLGAAATSASGTTFNDPETCTQFVLEVAERLLDWMRSKK
jgi:hypothetical protein